MYDSARNVFLTSSGDKRRKNNKREEECEKIDHKFKQIVPSFKRKRALMVAPVLDANIVQKIGYELSDLIWNFEQLKSGTNS